jgi:hypothetical protein
MQAPLTSAWMLVVSLPYGMGSKNVLKRGLNGSVKARHGHNTGGNQTTAQAILNPQRH